MGGGNKEIMDIIANVNESKFKSEKQFIAYIDILGYEHLVKKYGTAKIAAIIDAEIKKSKYFAEGLTGDDFSKIILAQTNTTEADMSIRQKVFSDNFFFCTKGGWFNLVYLIPYLQNSLINYGIFIRGAMCYGEIYWDEDEKFICGDGLIYVHKLESVAAIYPRILIDGSFHDHIRASVSMLNEIYSDALTRSTGHLFGVDYDYHSFIDYLSYGHHLLVSRHNGKERNDKIESARKLFLDFLSHHRNILCENLRKNKSNINIHSKYLWCKRYHNNFCEQHHYTDYLIA